MDDPGMAITTPSNTNHDDDHHQTKTCCGCCCYTMSKVLEYVKRKVWKRSKTVQSTNSAISPDRHRRSIKDKKIKIQGTTFDDTAAVTSHSSSSLKQQDARIDIHTNSREDDDDDDDDNNNIGDSNNEFGSQQQLVVATKCRKRKAGRRKRGKKQRITSNNETISNLPEEIIKNPDLKKYWINRYRLFSKYDQGILLDEESWYSVTPEKISKHIAERCRSDVIVDGFCGAGGNTIQFAFTCERVIAIDINPEKIELAKNNAKVYNVDDRIEFIVGDFFRIMPTLKAADVVFLSPPWGGPNYLQMKPFKLNYMLEQNGGGEHLFKVAKAITDHVAFYLPRNVDIDEVKELARRNGNEVEIEENTLNNKLIALTAYYGELIYFDD